VALDVAARPSPAESPPGPAPAAGAAGAALDLSYLLRRGEHPTAPLTRADVTAALALARAARNAGRLVVLTGGRAGRIGESVVQSGVAAALLAATRCLRRPAPEVTLLVDARVRALFDAALLRRRYGAHLEVVPGAGDDPAGAARELALEGFAPQTLLLDLHGGRDGPPALRSEVHRRGPHAPALTLHTAQGLFRPAVIAYARRGPRRRYADFAEDLLGLPRGAVGGAEAQPAVLLAGAERAQAGPMLARLGLAPDALPFLCFFQSAAVAKCYDSWWDVMEGIAGALHAVAPERQVGFVVACGPNESGRPGLDPTDLEALFGPFAARRSGARVHVRVCAIGALRDLAILATRCVVLANDTGPGHLAGAAGAPVVTPFLPGEVYPQRVWASTPGHRGAAPPPGAFSAREVRDAVLWDENRVVSAVPPAELVALAVEAAVERFAL
jgi:hypothetical protein